MRVVNARDFAEGFPCLDRHVSVGFGCEGQNHFSGINGGIEFGLPFAGTFQSDFIQATQDVYLMSCLPRHAFTTIADFFKQWSD